MWERPLALYVSINRYHIRLLPVAVSLRLPGQLPESTETSLCRHSPDGSLPDRYSARFQRFRQCEVVVAGDDVRTGWHTHPASKSLEFSVVKAHLSLYALRKQTPDPVFGDHQIGVRLPSILAARPRESSRRVEPRDHGLEFEADVHPRSGYRSAKARPTRKSRPQKLSRDAAWRVPSDRGIGSRAMSMMLPRPSVQPTAVRDEPQPDGLLISRSPSPRLARDAERACACRSRKWRRSRRWE